MKLFTDYQLAIIQFCAEQCARLRSGEVSVSGMLQAYQYAALHYSVVQDITPEDIGAMAAMINPEKNTRGYRQVPVHFGDFNILPWEHVPQQVTTLLAAQDSLSAGDFCLAYQGVHPHASGNGHIAAILFNVKNGTLFRPVCPPPFEKRAIVVAGVAVPR